MKFYCFGGIFVLFLLPSDPDDFGDPTLAVALTSPCDTLQHAGQLMVIINFLNKFKACHVVTGARASLR